MANSDSASIDIYFLPRDALAKASTNSMQCRWATNPLGRYMQGQHLIDTLIQTPRPTVEPRDNIQIGNICILKDIPPIWVQNHRVGSWVARI